MREEASPGGVISVRLADRHFMGDEVLPAPRIIRLSLSLFDSLVDLVSSLFSGLSLSELRFGVYSSSILESRIFTVFRVFSMSVSVNSWR